MEEKERMDVEFKARVCLLRARALQGKCWCCKHEHGELESKPRDCVSCCLKVRLSGSERGE